MTILFRSRGTVESRAVSFQTLWGRGESTSDITIGTTAESALRLVPLYAAHRLIIDQFASTPLHGYTQGNDGTRKRMGNDPALISMPSKGRGLFAWKAQAIASALSYGNAYGYITAVDGLGYATALEWLSPLRVEVDETGTADLPAPQYYYDGKLLQRDRVLHVPWIVQPGKYEALSPLAAFKLAFSTGAHAQASANDWFANGAIPSGHLHNNAKDIKPTDAEEVRNRFRAAVTGRDVLITGADWDYTTIGIPADEARFIETLRLTATQVATIYGVPADKIGGETGTSMTYATLEQNTLDFMAFAMRPWYSRFEEAFSSVLPSRVYVRFNADAMVRTDLLSRMTAHEIAQRSGIETNDEARALEDRPPLTTAQRSEWLTMWRQASIPQALRHKGNDDDDDA